MSNTTLIPTEEKMDLLNRQEFISQMLFVSETLSKNKKNACYALNGSWGVGKSFVLDMFVKQATQVGQEDSVLPRYLIFRYNCWEYDYYNEPLFAIVASMLDQIEENVNLLSEKWRCSVLGVLKEIANRVFQKTIRLIDDKTGIPATKILEKASRVAEVANAEIAESQAYDEYITFKDTLAKLKGTLSSLANEQTIIFIVDELDRCLPEYTIKVLERLHHLFDCVSNSQIILSIDKKQIQYAVKNIYGKETSTDKYLAKFIGFELELDEGTLNDFRFALGAYYKRFIGEYRNIKEGDVDQFITTILRGVDMRERIAIIERCQLIHNLICNDTQLMDYSTMCIELLLMLLHKYKIDMAVAKQRFTISEVFAEHSYHRTAKHPAENNEFSQNKELPLGLKMLNERYGRSANKSGNSRYIQWNTEDQITLIYTSDLWGLILAGYRYLLGFEEDYWMYDFSQQNDFKDHIKNFWNLVQIIH